MCIAFTLWSFLNVMDTSSHIFLNSLLDMLLIYPLCNCIDGVESSVCPFLSSGVDNLEDQHWVVLISSWFPS